MSIENALNKIRREAGIKRCLVVEGNVSDVYLRDRKIIGIGDCLTAVLKDAGYSDIVYWDRASGIQGETGTLRLTDEEPEQRGDVYDISDLNLPETNVTGSCKDFGDMLAVIHRTMSDQSLKTAFILNWSDYLFSAGQLDPSDRANLTLLGKSIKDSVPRFTTEDRGSTILLVTSKSSMIPISLYSGNPESSLVTITKPDSEERSDLMKRISPAFNIRGEPEFRDSSRFQDYVDMLNDFTNREIIQLARMSRTEPTTTFEKLFYLFLYGEKENPWEKMNPDKVRSLKQRLTDRVIGQDEAIRSVEDTIIKAFTGLTGMHKSSSRSMPKGIFFFVGPTGVGKTELSKALANFLFGDDDACIRFDMSEYTQPNSDQKLIGAPPGYVGFEEGGQLTNAIREKPFSVVLFDEIEKAAKPNPRILDIFLQILEDGRLTDNRGETTYFGDTVIIFTSNLGASEVKNSGNYDRTSAEFTQIVKEYFDNELKRPEILGRIGYENIVPFNFINDPEFALNIARSKMNPIRKGILEKYKIELELEDDRSFFNHILEGADLNKGGRDILNALDARLLVPMSRFLFENYDDLFKYRGYRLIISVIDGKLRFDIDE